MYMSARSYYLLVSALLFTACATTPPEAHWPAGMPEINHYQRYYAQDVDHHEVSNEQDYLKWVKRFYLGSPFYDRGWFDASEEYLESLPPEVDQAQIETDLYLIGKKVSAEWAKADPHRVINTRHVIIWGNAMKRAMGDGSQEVLISQLHQDVDALLAGIVKPKAINKSRYRNLGEDVLAEVPFGEGLGDDF